MRRYAPIIIGLLLLLCPLAANAFTLNFDDIAAGSELDVYRLDGVDVFFGGDFDVMDSTGSSWGPPHSGNNVLAGILGISLSSGPYSVNGGHIVPANYFGAYFSTQLNAVVEVAFYDYASSTKVGSITIGKIGESWTNRYAEFSSDSNNFNAISYIIRTMPPGACEPFIYTDDVTINPVPEPSGILALLAGAVGIGGMVWRRR